MVFHKYLIVIMFIYGNELSKWIVYSSCFLYVLLYEIHIFLKMDNIFPFSRDNIALFHGMSISAL